MAQGNARADNNKPGPARQPPGGQGPHRQHFGQDLAERGRESAARYAAEGREAATLDILK